MPWLPEGLVFMGIMIFFAFFFDFLNFSLIYQQVCGNLIITFASIIKCCAQYFVSTQLRTCLRLLARKEVGG